MLVVGSSQSVYLITASASPTDLSICLVSVQSVQLIRQVQLSNVVEKGHLIRVPHLNVRLGMSCQHLMVICEFFPDFLPQAFLLKGR